jgi:hypothetical protein
MRRCQPKHPGGRCIAIAREVHNEEAHAVRTQTRDKGMNMSNGTAPTCSSCGGGMAKKMRINVTASPTMDVNDVYWYCPSCHKEGPSSPWEKVEPASGTATGTSDEPLSQTATGTSELPPDTLDAPGDGGDGDLGPDTPAVSDDQ